MGKHIIRPVTTSHHPRGQGKSEPPDNHMGRIPEDPVAPVIWGINLLTGIKMIIFMNLPLHTGELTRRAYSVLNDKGKVLTP